MVTSATGELMPVGKVNLANENISFDCSNQNVLLPMF
jgi:hypothetical protein